MFERDVRETGINQLREVPEIQAKKKWPEPQGVPRPLTGAKSVVEKPVYGLHMPRPGMVSRATENALYEDYSVLGASARQWDTTKIIRGVDWDQVQSRARFGEDDPNFKLTTAIKESGIGVTDREFEWLTSRKPRNKEELDFLMDYIKDDKQDMQILSSHPVKAFAYGSLDPAYIAVGGAVGAGGKALGFGRVATGLSGASADTAVGMVAYNYNPDMTYTDIAANAVIGAVLGTAFGGRGRKRGSDIDNMKFKAHKPEGYDTQKYKPNLTITVPLSNKAPKGYDGLVSELQGNVGGYHDGAVPEWTKKGNTITMVDPSAREAELAYSQPTYSGYQKASVSYDMNGQPYMKAENKWKYDTPKAVQDMTGLAKETIKDNGGPARPNGWTFIKNPDWHKGASEVGLPSYKDIDWKASVKEGLPLRKTMFHYLYKIMDNVDMPPALRASASHMITHGGERLTQVPYTKTYHPSPKGGSFVGGYYKPKDDSVRIRQHKGLEGRVPYTEAHEAMHAMTAYKVAYGRRNPDSVHARIVQDLDKLRMHVSKLIKEDTQFKKEFERASESEKHAWDYALSSTDEFLSSIAEMSSDKLKLFRETLNAMPVPEGLKGNERFNVSNVLQYLMNEVRKLLNMDIQEANSLFKAMGLADELLQSPTIDIHTLTGFRRIPVNADNLPARLMSESIGEAEIMAKKGLVMEFGEKVSWNAFKTVHKFDADFAKTFLNDPLGTNPGNVQNIRQARRSQFIDKYRTVWEERLMKAFKESGIKWYDYLIRPKKVRDIQNQVSRQVTQALTEIEAGNYRPDSYPKAVQDIVKSMDDFGRDAARQLVEAGLLDPAVLKGKGGYFARRWNATKIQDVVTKIADNHFGGDHTKALNYLAEQMGASIRYADINDKLRFEYGRALIQRALAKAENTDLIYRGHLGLETAYEVRRILEARGVDSKDVDRVLGIVTGKIEEAGKESWQKSRMDLDMTWEMQLPDGTIMKVSDLLDSDNIFQGMARYLEDTSGRLALAEKGIKTTADMENTKRDLVGKFMQGGMMKSHAEQLAEDLFNSTLGRPVGEVMHTWGRIISGTTQMMALRNSGFWQVTELAKAYLRALTTQGFVNANKFMAHAFGDFKAVADPATARRLDYILSRKSWNEVRLRPFVDMYEDNHAMKSNKMSSFQHGTSMVYHINGMATVQRLQANYASKVLVANLEEAVTGNTKLREYFGKFGLSEADLDAIKVEIDKHGLMPDNWDYKVWNKADVALTSIMDTDVLRSQLGDVPLFFQFSTVGKIIGTFQNFTLTSHNKIMANAMANDGIKGIAALVALQLPLAMLMTQVSAVSGGRGFIEDPMDWVGASMAQMGTLGLFVNLVNAVQGNMSGLGGAMMISVDKAADVSSKALQGEFGQALDSAMKNIPLVSLIPGWGLAIEAIMEAGGLRDNLSVPKQIDNISK